MRRNLFKLTPLALALFAAQTAAVTLHVNTTTVNGYTVRISPGPAPVYAPTASHGVHEMPPSTQFEINGAALMAPNYGYSTLRIATNTCTTGGCSPVFNSSGGAFRISCATSHMGFFDPIVYPFNVMGNAANDKSHLHTFFGNSDITWSTDFSIDPATYGRSSCAGGIANRSAYWVPAMIDTSTGLPQVPSSNLVYYKNDSDYRAAHLTAVTVPVPKLRMIAGNPANTSTTLGGVYRFECLIGNVSQGQVSTIPGTCPVGAEVLMVVLFPQCWDGVNLDSVNHQSHMAYEDFSTGCPGTHPVMIPQISYNIHYAVTSKSSPANWRLSSDTYPIATAAGGLSAHGDWINGWSQTVLSRVVNDCLRISYDCHANDLGPGPPAAVGAKDVLY